MTKFEKQWGISCNELAELENVTPEAIRMRIKNFGTPFQRRSKQTKFEKKYGMTIVELAMEQGLHPVTIARREYLYNDAYFVCKQKNGEPFTNSNKGKILNDRNEHWSESGPWSGRIGRSYYVKGKGKGKDE